MSQTTLYRIFQNAVTLLQDRGYDRKTIQNYKMDFDQFCKFYKSGPVTVYAKTLDKEALVFISNTGPNFKKKELVQITTHIIKGLKDNNYSLGINVILVIGKKPDKTIRAEFGNISVTNGIKLEYFMYDNLIINPIKHILVPTHELLTSDEKNELLGARRFTLEQLPKIYVTDPIARWYGANVNNIFKVTRPSQTTISEIIYRQVIPAPLL